MEGFAKVLLTLTVVLGVLSVDVNGAGRTLKPKDEFIDQPQTFGSLGGSFPSPGFSGSFPSPGFGGSFPSPGFGGSFPSPGFGGSFPVPSLGTGPSTFCSFPGVRCAPVVPNKAAGSDGSASVSGSP